MLRITKRPQNGQILVALIISVPFLMLIVASYLTLSSSNLRLAKQDQLLTHSQLAADAGADYAIEQINQNGAWTGTSGEVTLHNDGTIKTTYDVSVTNDDNGDKTLTSTGRSYWPAGATTPSTSVKILVDLRPVSSGNYSVVSGEGGLIMSNNSKIVSGDVYINGTITMNNNSQIGLSTNPVSVEVADGVCPVPPDSTYPRICTSGDGQPQPISINNNARIYGTVKANNQTSGSSMSNPGLVTSSGVATEALPVYDRAGQKAAVANTMTASAASCSTGSVTWPANTHITGSVSVSNSCTVTVQGNIWIDGNFTVSNSAKVIVSDSLGSTRPVIMVDGSGGANFSNGAKLVSNSSGTGFEVITFWSAASCSPDCASVTGADLYNSRNQITINLANNSEGAQTIFYSYWSKVEVSNSSQIGALIGQTIEMANSGAITFGSSTQLGDTFWVVDGYRRGF